MQTAIMKEANVNDDGRVQITLSTSNNAGYNNVCEQYAPYGIFSIPNADVRVNIETQSYANVVVTGYNNTITDVNFSEKTAGTVVTYSNNWYNITTNTGIYYQPRNSGNKENAIAGQTTNKVLIDIMQIIIDIVTYLQSHQHEAGAYQANGTPVTGTSGSPASAPPSTSTITKDKTNVTSNANLIITGSYKPYNNW